MYDIKNLNIWKASSNHNIFGYRNKVLETEVSKGRENIMSEKCQNVFDEILTLVPTTKFSEIKKNKGGKLRFPIYITEKLRETDLEALDLSVRSSNCLHRAGYSTIGELVEKIETFDDLKRIRNCGDKSVKEIMEKLFCYQYCQLDTPQKIKYINKMIELN